MSSDHQGEAEARQRREEALRALGQQSAPPAAPQPRGRLATALPPTRRRRVLLNVLAMVALVAVLAVAGTVSGVAPWARRAGPVATQTVSISLSLDRLSCAAGVAWSPNGKQIAVLADQGDCTTQGGEVTLPQVVALYDLRGNLTRELSPDALTLGHAATPTPTTTPAPMPSTTISAHYSGLSWSPDGTRLALGYVTEAIDPKAEHPEVLDLGVALLPTDGSSGRLLHQPRDSNSKVWNAQTGAATGEDTAALTPALSFVWAADGTLAPGASDAGQHAGPVGTPSGGQSFTVWQPGVIGYDAQSATLSYGTAVMPWAPGGRFVGAEMSLPFYLATSGPALRPAALDIPTITYRDAAMQRVAADLKASALANALAPVAWRADGQRLAAVVPEKTIAVAQQTGGVPYVPEHIAIYDCASGQLLQTLSTAKITTRTASAYGASVVAWSPDGHRVLLLDAAYGVLTVWGPEGLPE